MNTEEDLDDLLNQAVEEHNPKPYDYGTHMLEKIEDEFKSIPSANQERVNEKEDLAKKMAELTKRLRKSKNVRNPRKTQINKSISEKRKQLKAEIEQIKDRLYQIDLEEKGAQVTSENLVDTTIGQQ